MAHYFTRFRNRASKCRALDSVLECYLMRPKKNPGAGRDKVYIYGKHALVEALTSTPHIIKKVFLSHEAADKEMKALLADNNIPTVPLATSKGKEMVGRDATHQGVIAIMDPSALLIPFEDFIEKLDTTKNPSIAILGEIHDPHNVGAIIRSAAAFGLSAVLIPRTPSSRRHRCCGEIFGGNAPKPQNPKANSIRDKRKYFNLR